MCLIDGHVSGPLKGRSKDGEKEEDDTVKECRAIGWRVFGKGHIFGLLFWKTEAEQSISNESKRLWRATKSDWGLMPRRLPRFVKYFDSTNKMLI